MTSWALNVWIIARNVAEESHESLGTKALYISESGESLTEKEPVGESASPNLATPLTPLFPSTARAVALHSFPPSPLSPPLNKLC
jgi:hypothetical protein